INKDINGLAGWALLRSRARRDVIHAASNFRGAVIAASLVAEKPPDRERCFGVARVAGLLVRQLSVQQSTKVELVINLKPPRRLACAAGSVDPDILCDGCSQPIPTFQAIARSPSRLRAVRRQADGSQSTGPAPYRPRTGPKWRAPDCAPVDLCGAGPARKYRSSAAVHFRMLP